jgi:Flp pilus assembly protein TadD
MVLREQPPAMEWKLRFPNPAVLCLLLAAITMVVWWPVVHCDFLNYDDPDYYTANPHVQTGLTWANIVWAFTTGHASNWHPITWLSLMLDAAFSGKEPAGPHFTNLLFHAANTVLLFLLLRRLTRLREDASAWQAAATWRSALVAALFALHPLHVESVAWVSERKDVLSAFFGLLSLWAYARYVRELKVPGSKFKVFYALALMIFALGLMSKPMLVTLPLLMLLLDWWPLQRFKVQGSEFRVQKLIREKIPFFILSAVSCVVTFIAQQKGGTVAALVKIPMTGRIENAFVSCARYLGKTFWPATLATPYPLPGQWPVGQVLLAATAFAGLCAAAIILRRKFPFLFTGWFWFVIMLIPVIGLVQVGNAAMADRYTYLPLVGVFIVLVWGLGEIVVHWRVPQPIVAILALGLLLAAALRMRDQIGYWQNSGTLFSHTLAVTKNNFVAENDFGAWLSKHGQVMEAIDHFHRSLQIEPDNPDAIFNLGNACAQLGDWDEAIADYQRALHVAPARADLLDNLGRALAARKQYAEAITNFEAALKLDPDSANAHNNLATVLFIEHQFDEAARHYREALRLSPGDARIYANLGDTLVRLGQTPEAAKCYQEALQLDPGNASLQAKLRALGAEVPR